MEKEEEGNRHLGRERRKKEGTQRDR
jgi:hypothetical protein